MVVDTANIVALALAEDIGAGDVTTDALVPDGAVAAAQLLLEEPGVVSGLSAAEAVFRALDPDARFDAELDAGDRVELAPAVVARVECAARAILTGERTALNLLGRLSGVATLTRAYADAIAGTGAVLLDTRKTTPGLRVLEKQAVLDGGGSSYRVGLFDAILVKDNHLRLVDGIAAAVAQLRSSTDLPVEVEADTLDQVAEALEAGADRILLDNMSTEEIAQAVDLVAGRAELEASGGVTLATVRSIAETGVGFISVGALTHSARSLDVSLEVVS